MAKLQAQHETVIRLFRAYRKQGMTVSGAISVLSVTLQLSEEQIASTLNTFSDLI